MNENGIRAFYPELNNENEELGTLKIQSSELHGGKYNDGFSENVFDESLAVSGWLKRLEAHPMGKYYLKLIGAGMTLSADQEAHARQIMGLPRSEAISEMFMRLVTGEADRKTDLSGTKYPFPDKYLDLVMRDIEKRDLTMIEEAWQVGLQEFPEDHDGAALVMLEFLERQDVKLMSNRQKATLVGKREFPLHHLGSALASLEYLEKLNLAKMTDEQRARLAALREFHFRGDIVELAVDLAMGRLRGEDKKEGEIKLNVYRTYKNAGPTLANLAINDAFGILSVEQVPVLEDQKLRYKVGELLGAARAEFSEKSTGRGIELAEREALNRGLSFEEKQLCKKAHVVRESLFKPLNVEEKRDLKSYRSLKNLPEFGRLSFLIYSRSDGTINKYDAADLAAHEEFFVQDEAEYVELARKEILSQGMQRRGTKPLIFSGEEKLKLAQYRACKNLPNEIEGQRLYVQKQIGELSQVEEADLVARQEFPGRPHLARLVKNEILGRVKSKRHKIKLEAHREMIHDEVAAELLAKKKLGEISEQESADLQRRREVQYNLIDGVKLLSPVETFQQRKVTLAEADVVAEMEFPHYKPAAKLVVLELIEKIKPNQRAELLGFRKFFADPGASIQDYGRILSMVELYKKKLLHDESLLKRSQEPAGQKSPIYKVSLGNLAELKGFEEFPEVFQQEAAELVLLEEFAKHGGVALTENQENLLKGWRKFPMVKEAAVLYSDYLRLGVKMPALDRAKMMAFLEFSDLKDLKDQTAHQLVLKESLGKISNEKLTEEEREFLSARREFVYYRNGLRLMAREAKGEPLTDGERMAYEGFIHNPVNTLRAELILLEAKDALKPDQAALLTGLREFGDDIVGAKLAAREAMGLLKTKEDQRLIQAFRVFKNDPLIVQLLSERTTGKITRERLAKLKALRKFPLHALAAEIAEKIFLDKAAARDFRYLRLFDQCITAHDDRMVDELEKAYRGDLDAELALKIKLDLRAHPVLLEVITANENSNSEIEHEDILAAIRRQLCRENIRHLENDFEENRVEILKLRARIEFPLDKIPACLVEEELLAEDGRGELAGQKQILLFEYRRFARAVDISGRRPTHLLNMEVSNSVEMVDEMRIELSANREFVEFPIAVKLVMEEQKCLKEGKLFDIRKAKILRDYRMFVHNPAAVAVLNKEQAFIVAFAEFKVLPEYTDEDRATLTGFRAFPSEPIPAALERDFILGTLDDGQDILFLAEFRRNKHSRYIIQLLNQKYQFEKFGVPMEPRLALQLKALLAAPSGPLPFFSNDEEDESIDVVFDD